jgi:hypothetical protein
MECVITARRSHRSVFIPHGDVLCTLGFIAEQLGITMTHGRNQMLMSVVAE